MSEDPGESFGEAFGRAVKLGRAVQNLSRSDLAEASGLSYSYLAEIENGKKRPSSRAISRIAEALGVSLSELMYQTEYWSQPGVVDAVPEGAPIELGGLPREQLTATAGTSRDGSRPGGARSRQRRWLESLTTRTLSARPSAAAMDVPGAALSEGLDSSLAEPAPGESQRELIELFGLLGPEDRDRVVDLARRLAERSDES